MLNLAPAHSLAVRALGLLLVAYLTLVMYLNLPLFFARLGVVSNAAVFDRFLVVAAFPFVLLTWHEWKGFMRREYFWWCVVLGLVFLVNYWRLPGVDAVVDVDEFVIELNRAQRVILMILYAYAAYVIGRERFEPWLLVATAIGAAAVILDFFRPELFRAALDQDYSGRSEGTYLNANVAAEALVVGLLLVYRRAGPMLMSSLYLVVGFAILVTFSRSGLTAWIIFGFIIYAGRKLPRWFLVIPVVIVLSYSTLLIYAEDVLSSMFENEGRVANMVDRLSFFGDVSGTGLDDDSSEGRAELAREISLASLEQPLLGHVRSPVSVFGNAAHNLLIEYWYQFGVVGLALCLYMIRMLHRHAVTRLFGVISPEVVVFTFFLFFNHTQLETNVWFVFYAVALCGGRNALATRRRGDMVFDLDMLRERFRRRPKRRARSVRPGGWRGRFG